MNSNQQSLREKYFKASDVYARLYQQYLDAKYSSVDSERAKADQIYQKLQSEDAKLRSMLDQIKQQEGDVSNKILETNNAIERKTFQIYEKSKTLDLQNAEIERKRTELHNRQKQIEMGIQKNRYRRNVIIFLTIINIIMLIAVYRFYYSG